MEIYRIDHLSQVVPELEPQLELLEGLFGFRRIQTWDHDAERCSGARLAIPGSWGQHWEVLAPTSDDSPHRAFLDGRGGRPGLHHMALEVPDVVAVTVELERLGIAATVEAPGQWIEASLSPPGYGAGFLFRIRGTGTHTMCGDDGKVSGGGRPGRNDPSLGIVQIDHV